MVREITFILLLITFFGAHIVFEMYLKKNGKKIKMKNVGIVAIGIESILICLAAHITVFFYVLIYGTVIIASFISVLFRYKQNENKLFKNAS